MKEKEVEKVKVVLAEWKKGYCETGIKTWDDIDILGFDEIDWDILLKRINELTSIASIPSVEGEDV